MEDGLPIYWQQNQEEGKSTSLPGKTGSSAHLAIFIPLTTTKWSFSLTQSSVYGIILQIVFVENKKLSSTLLSDIDESQLPDTYGGKLPLVPIQDC